MMTRDKAMVLALILGTGVWFFFKREPYQSEYPYDMFINPDAVADIAASLPQDEDSFILSAWDLVGKGIQYRDFGTIMNLTPSGVECDACLLPRSVLQTGGSNCVGKSELLTSILRNRLPPNRVYMAIGELKLNQHGGHAWVRVQRGGEWYAVEATSSPPEHPWVTEESVSFKYEPDGYLNDQSFHCISDRMCLSIQNTSCLPYVT